MNEKEWAASVQRAISAHFEKEFHFPFSVMSNRFLLMLAAVASLALLSCRKIVSHENIPMDPGDSASVQALLSANGIDLPPDSFKIRIRKDSYGKVEGIDLSGLNLDSLSLPFSSPVLPQCVLFNLSGNRLVKVSGEFKHIEGITDLYLYGNKLQELPAGVSGMGNLKGVLANNNNIRSVSNAIGTNPELHFLNLGDNELTSFPPEIPGIKKLAYLDLRRNKIAAIDSAAFCPSGHIQTITLAENLISTVPSCDFSQWKLQVFDVSRNKLDSFPSTFNGLTAFRALALGHNSFASLPEGIGTMTSLQTFRFNNNNVRSIPLGYLRLTNLLVDHELGGLDLDSNRLCNLPDSVQIWVNAYVKRSGRSNVWKNAQLCN